MGGKNKRLGAVVGGERARREVGVIGGLVKNRKLSAADEHDGALSLQKTIRAQLKPFFS